MRRIVAQLLVTAFTFAVPFLASTAASAAPGPEACGNLDLTAKADCQVVVTGGCDVSCTPVSFQAECHARCEGGCTASATVDCNTTCNASCTGMCTGTAGSIDCKGTCEASCGASCDGHCMASGNKAECKAACQANCGGECDISCKATPPMATCAGQCEASCSGSCKAEANVDCQVDCQGGCTAELQGGCKAKCESPDGALFCDGSYLDVGNLDDCKAYLASIGVKVQYSGSAECSGNQCSAEAEASASCAAAPGPSAPLGGLLATAVAGIGVAVVRRRNKRA